MRKIRKKDSLIKHNKLEVFSNIIKNNTYYNYIFECSSIFIFIKYRIKLVKQILKYLISIIMIISNNTKEIRKIYYNNNYITLKINEIGNITIYNKRNLCKDEAAPMPDEIYINEINQSEIKSFYIFNQTGNEIKLIWKNIINSTACMFSGCNKIIEIDLSNFDTSLVTDMKYMFLECKSLTSLNLSNINTSQVTNMNELFGRCEKLNPIDLSNFDTSQVTNMYGMFYSCDNVISLDLSKFNTSQVTIMEHMFCGCEKITSFNLSNFDTSLVTTMKWMFASNYYVLRYIDLSSFNTSKVTNMYGMFQDSYKIISLNLSNFDTSNVKDMNYMFSSCRNLIYLDLSNFNTLNVESIYGIFSDTSSLKYINLQNSKIKNYLYIFNEILINHDRIIICGKYNLKLNSSKININCKNNYNESINYLCYINFSNIITNNYLCDICGNNPNNNINCNITKDGYYLDKIDNQFYFKQCYSSCKLCDKRGTNFNHNCIECKENYEPELNFSNYFNCFCNNYYYINKITNELSCLPNKTCPYSYRMQIFNKKECVNNCNISSIYKYEYNNICYDEYNYITNNIYLYIIHNISQFENLKEYLSSIYNKNNLFYFNDTEFKLENILITLSTTENQKTNINKNKTSIYLGECENKLKDIYNISKNNSLFILKFDIFEKGMKIPKIEYEVYYPLNNSILIKLNLSFCKNMKIDISIPISIKDDINKYNKNSKYYNDLCTKSVSDSGVDLSLFDRKNIFINNNMTLCEEDCDLIDYNYSTEKAKCSCLIKINIPFVDTIKFDKKKLLKSFTDINNFANIKFMKCYKIVLKIKNLKKNIGFFIYIIIIIIYFISLFLHYFKYYSYLIKEIDQIIEAKNIIFDLKSKYENCLIKNKNKNNITKKKQKKFIPILNSENRGIIKFRNIPFTDNSKNKLNLIQITSNDKNEEINNKENYIKSLLKTDKDYLKYKEILKYTDNELDSLSYLKALKHDKRTYIQYYLSLLKIKHPLLFSFNFKNKDYNSQIIKIFLFFFYFSLHMAINALFFTDSTMHKIYLDEGNFNFIYQISQIIYSSIISSVLSLLTEYLALTEINILELKKEKKIEILNLNAIKTKNSIKYKLALFFILTFLLLILFLYYITCFCGVYINTQYHLIKDSIISFGLSLIYPFGLLFIPGIFRLIALYAKNKDREYIYKFSQFIQEIIN